MNNIRNERQRQNLQQNQNNNPVNRRERRENPDLFRRVQNLAMPQVVAALGPAPQNAGIDREAL